MKRSNPSISLTKIFALLILTVSGNAFTQPVAQSLDIENNFCDHEPKHLLCSTIPNDVSDFSASLVYTLIEKNAQSPFDLFSWQTFVGLNWPLREDGSASTEPIGSSPEAPRVWQRYITIDDLFERSKPEGCSQNGESGATLNLGQFVQAGGDPLVDQAGNYVVFDSRVNHVMEAYIRENQLHRAEGQKKFAASGKQISFPKGHYQNPEFRIGGSQGAMAIKTAWRIFKLHDRDAKIRFFTRDSLVEVDAGQSLTGKPICILATLGLVGMHIVHRTESGNGGDWIWTTFEHADNAPMADNARGPNNIFAEQLFEDGCKVPKSHQGQYSFFNPQCEHCKINAGVQLSKDLLKWADKMPYARSQWDSPIPPNQVARCWSPSIGTMEINKVWQQKLSETVWQHYSLSTTQWRGASKGPLFPNGEVPRYLTNSTMETFIQSAPKGSCMGCHSVARTSAGQWANFSFVFFSAEEIE